MKPRTIIIFTKNNGIILQSCDTSLANQNSCTIIGAIPKLEPSPQLPTSIQSVESWDWTGWRTAPRKSGSYMRSAHYASRSETYMQLHM